MEEQKKAAIDADEILNSPLEKISASQFLTALDFGKANYLRVWPEKKKYELYVEPEGSILGKLNLREILEKLRGEKKKVEIEIDNFKDLIFPPDFYQQLVRDVAREIRGRIQ